MIKTNTLPATQPGLRNSKLFLYYATTFLAMLALVSCGNSGQKKGTTDNSAKSVSDSTGQLRSLQFCNLATVEPEDFDYGDLHASDCPYSYNKVDLDGAIEDFDNHFKTRAGDPLPTTNHEVRISSLNMLLSEIATQYPTHIGSEDHRGIRMHYGIDTSGSMIIIFEPVWLNRLDALFTINAVPKYYIVNGGNLTRITEDVKNSFVNAYQSADNNIRKVKIIHMTSGLPDHFNDSNDFNLGDTKYSTISFKEIFDMYQANRSEPCSNSHTITFRIVASNYYVKVRNYKLHVIAYHTLPVEDDDQYQGNTYKGMAADFTQMNPPYHLDKIFLPVGAGFTKEEVRIRDNKNR